MNNWRCCDCKKFVTPGVVRCLNCSIDHGAMKRYIESKPEAGEQPAGKGGL